MTSFVIVCLYFNVVQCVTMAAKHIHSIYTVIVGCTVLHTIIILWYCYTATIIIIMPMIILPLINQLNNFIQ